jgi:hypothetical protein
MLTQHLGNNHCCLLDENGHKIYHNSIEYHNESYNNRHHGERSIGSSRLFVKTHYMCRRSAHYMVFHVENI